MFKKLKKYLKNPNSKIRIIYDLVKGTITGFIEDKVPKMAASLSYYTIFSITPLLVVIISIISKVYKREAFEGKLFAELANIVGTDAAMQIQTFVANSNLTGKNTLAIIIGAVSLVLGATAVFGEIQDSINYIWKVKAVKRKGIVKMIIDRLISFSLVVTVGFLLLVSLIVSVATTELASALAYYLPEGRTTLLFIINNLVTLIIIGSLFTIIFRVLPDAKVRWKSSIVGALVTAVLFMVGKYLIEVYIASSNPGKVYGAASSIFIMLLWVYYTAFILYFGAEFTQVYAEKFGLGIRPADYAVYLEVIEKEKEVSVLPDQHPEYTETPPDAVPALKKEEREERKKEKEKEEKEKKKDQEN